MNRFHLNVDDAILFLLLAFHVVETLLLCTFLYGFSKLRTLIQPLLDKFLSKSGGARLPTIKEALGLGLAKLIESVDFGKMIGQVPK